MAPRPHGSAAQTGEHPPLPISLGDLAQALEHSQEGFALTDPDGNYVYLNEAHLRMYGYERAPELLGRNWRTLYSPEWAGHIASHVLPLLPARKAWRGQVVGRRRDGSPILAHVTLTLLPDGKITCNCRDESPNRPSAFPPHACICPPDRAALRELGELLVAGLPRKLRPSADLLAGYASFFLDETANGRPLPHDTLREGLAAMLAAGQDVAAQMERLELVAAMAAGSGTGTPADHAWPARLARACRERASRAGRADDLSIRLEQASPAIPYPALECLAGELLANAIQSSRPGDALAINGEAQSTRYILKVCDEGVGWTDHGLDTACDRPFGQSSPAGFGLAVVRYILRRVGGTLSVDLNGCNATCLRLTLPLLLPAR